MKKPKKPKSDLIIIPLMVVTFFVTYFICKQNLIEVFKNNTSNKDVKAPKKVAVEKLDINDLDQATIEESINSGSTIVPNEDNNVTEEDINNANTNTNNTGNGNNTNNNSNSNTSNNGSSNNSNNINSNKKYLIEGNFLSDGTVTDKERTAMEYNTKTLQSLVNGSKSNEIITISSGTYYFSKGGTAPNEDYVIKLTNNTTIIGSGTSGNKATILKPYAPDNTIEYGMDMFYYNNVTDSGRKEAKYLENVKFSNFVIDGKDVRAKQYTSAGKGFMINLCKNCFWDNMIVRNTDGTGFGMDNIINGKISNSTAENCGKIAPVDSGGGAGFGIGTGYSDDEYVVIENCKAIGNKRFGFFFEHQGYFTNYYKATKAKGFIVKNSTATGNLYNFGANRGNDVSYINCTSTIDNTANDGTPIGYTRSDMYFTDQSRRTRVENFQTDNMFNDVSKTSPYYNAIKWAYLNSITYGIGNNTFGLNINTTRADAITMLWRYANRPGEVVTGLREAATINTGFNDIPSNALYAGAVKWAVSKGITNGTSSTTFSPNEFTTREQFVTMLWRYAGSPRVEGRIPFTDVSKNTIYYNAINWAYQKNITNGTSNTTFSPNLSCTREQIVTMLYRYNNTL